MTQAIYRAMTSLLRHACVLVDLNFMHFAIESRNAIGRERVTCLCVILCISPLALSPVLRTFVDIIAYILIDWA